MQVNILEARNRLSQLIRSVQAGEQVIIANRGEPVARLVSARTSEPTGQDVGSGRVILDWIEENRLPAYAQRSAEEIDAAVAEERASWD